MLKQIEGSHAVADVVALCRPNVISAYPITPQTHIVEGLAQIVGDGKLDAEDWPSPAVLDIARWPKYPL